ncbi:META domain-containing protein [Colwellia echini]|nr:META domain-containing protein [Colwellia echini]
MKNINRMMVKATIKNLNFTLLPSLIVATSLLTSCSNQVNETPKNDATIINSKIIKSESYPQKTSTKSTTTQPYYLQNHRWQWQGSWYNNDTKIIPTKPSLYQLSFSENGQLNITADCNSANTTYSTNGINININKNYPITQAFCGEASLDNKYLQDLMRVNSWLEHQGALILELEGHTGHMKFIPLISSEVDK